MKPTLPLSVAATLLLFSFTLPGGELRFAVPEKTRLSKVFDARMALHSTGISMRIDGKDADASMGGVTVHLDQSTHVELHDEYGAPKAGKPTTLKRTFDKLEGKFVQRLELPEGAPEHGPTETTTTRSSELEGKTVVFTLGDEGEYKLAFEDGKGDAGLLLQLEEDMDLRGLLPDGAVEADKSWEIDAKEFHSVLNLPGGELKLKAEGDTDNDTKLSQQLQEHAKGKVKGTYKGQREVDGHKYGVVVFEAELESAGQRENSEKAGGGTLDLKVACSVEGELLWDGEAGHFHSCKLESKLTLTMTDKRTIEHGGESHEFERTTDFEGEGAFTAELGS